MQYVFEFKGIMSTPRKNIYLNLRNRYFNLISSIQSKNNFRTNINLFGFNKSPFKPFLNKGNYFFNIIICLILLP